MSELEHKPPVQAQSDKDGHVPHLMRTDDPKNDDEPILTQNNSTDRVCDTSPKQRFDETKAVSPPEQDACDQSGPSAQKEDADPNSGWKGFRENRPQRNACHGRLTRPRVITPSV